MQNDYWELSVYLVCPVCRDDDSVEVVPGRPLANKRCAACRKTMVVEYIHASISLFGAMADKQTGV